MKDLKTHGVAPRGGLPAEREDSRADRHYPDEPRWRDEPASEQDDSSSSGMEQGERERLRGVLLAHAEKKVSLFPDMPWLKARFYYPPEEVERKVWAFNNVLSNYDESSHAVLRKVGRRKRRRMKKRVRT